MEIIYVRHARAITNELHPDVGIVGSDLELTETGIQQAGITAAYIAKLALKGTITLPDVIYSSPYIRTRQTAEPIAEAVSLPVLLDYRLREVDKGGWHGKRVRDVERWEADVEQHVKHVFRPPSGENSLDVADRMLDFIKDAEERGDRSLIVVSHNHPIECAIGALTGLPPTEWDQEENQVENASVSRLVKVGKLWHLDDTMFNITPWK